MAYKNFKVETDADGIALVTWDSPGKSMNVFDQSVIEDLDKIVSETTADANVKGVVITSGKEAFSGGADLTMLDSMRTVFADLLKTKGKEAANEALFKEAGRLSLIFRRIETCGKPWVAAINGLALGGAFELTLSCHYRVASDNPKTRLGLPEIQVGLFPGAGGTQRLARMLQPTDALTIMLKGEQLKLDRAKSLKLVDAIVPAADLIKTAKDWIKGGGKAVSAVGREGLQACRCRSIPRPGMMMFPAANALYRKETYDNYPAARAIMQSVYEGLQLPMDAALRVESRYFTHILQTKEAAAMIRSLFVSMQELNKGARRPQNVPPTKVKKLGVIGAGFMGASIGFVSAQAGIEVVLIDRDQASADKGKAHAKSVLDGNIARGRATEAERDAVLVAHHGDRRLCRDQGLRPDHRGGVRGPQGEGRDLRQGAAAAEGRRDLRLQHLDAADQLAGRGVEGPVEVHRHPLLLAGREDDAGRDHRRQEHRRRRARDRARLRAADPQDADRRQRLARLLRQPLRAALHRRRPRDAEGRRAAGDDREHGADGRHAGRAAVAVRRGRARSGAEDHEGDRGRSRSERHRSGAEEAAGRDGREARAASAARTARASTTIRPRARARRRCGRALPTCSRRKLDPDELDVEELKQRFLVVQAVEAARTVEDHVITDPREADVGSILGFGFAPFTGGTLSYIDFMGAKNFVALCHKLEAKYGSRFTPPKLLEEMAAKGETFYGRFRAEEGRGGSMRSFRGGAMGERSDAVFERLWRRTRNPELGKLSANTIEIPGSRALLASGMTPKLRRLDQAFRQHRFLHLWPRADALEIGFEVRMPASSNFWPIAQRRIVNR